jgi:HAD superfamily hydrolase (TIGR01549 family)
LAVLREYEQKDGRVKVIDFVQNQGVSVARNTGIDAAAGEYIGFVDSDDYVDKNFYESLHLSVQKGKYDIAKAELLTIDYSGNRNISDLNTLITKNKVYFLWQFTTAIYKVEFLKKNTIKFCTEFIIGEDCIFCINAITKSKKKIVLISGTNYNYIKRKYSVDSYLLSNKRFYNAIAAREYIIDYINLNVHNKKSYNIIFTNQIISILDLVDRSYNIGKHIPYIAEHIIINLNKCKYPGYYFDNNCIKDYNTLLLSSDVKGLTQKIVDKITIPVFISSDDAYSAYISTAIASICSNTKKNIGFFILDSGIGKENKDKIAKITEKFGNCIIEFLQIKKEMLEGLEYKNDNKYISIATYNRFFIPSIKPAINKAIYIDADIIAIGDISELFDQDLGEYLLGAVSESNINKQTFKKINRTLQLSKTHKYFNAGVLLIDCQRWRENDVLSKLFAIEKKYRKTLSYADQDILNKFFDSNYMPLDRRFNTSQDTTQFKTHDIILRHFSGRKPWDSDDIAGPNVNITDFWHYAKMTPFYEDICNNFRKKRTYNTYIPIYNKQVTAKLRKQVLYNQITAQHKNKILEEIIEIHDIISFDIFDTLLIRPFMKPADVFMYIESKLSNDIGFYKARILAEEVARKKIADKGKREEITFDEIYDNIAICFKKYKQVELDIEAQTIQPNLKMRELFNYAKSKGKIVIIVSDMYLPKSFVEKILIKNGFKEYNKLYLSSDIGLTKHTGNLYKYILNDMKFEQCKILHIGDNIESDILKAYNIGFSVYHIQKPSDIFFSMPNNKKFLTYYLSNPSNIDISIILGLIVNKWINGKFNNYWEDVGYKLGGPLAYCITKSIVEIENIRKFSDIIFVARDGYVLHTIYNMIKRKYDAKSHYVYANRRLRYNSFIEYVNDDQLLYIILAHFSKKNATNLTFEEKRAYLDSNMHLIKDKIDKNKIEYRKYIASFSLGNNVAVVDSIAENYSAQMLITDALQKAACCTGIYILVSRNNFIYNTISLATHENKRFNWDIIELFLTSPEKPAIGVLDSKPLFDISEDKYENIRKNIYLKIYEGEISFTNDIKYIFGDYNLEFDINLIFILFNIFFSNMTNDDIANFTSVYHNSGKNVWIPLVATPLQKTAAILRNKLKYKSNSHT